MVTLCWWQAYTRAGQYLIENFVIHGLVGAVALPMTILNISGVIDSTWAIVRFPSSPASNASGDTPVLAEASKTFAFRSPSWTPKVCCRGLLHTFYAQS